MALKSEPDASIGGGSGENFSNNGFGDPVSPRKKPRKQQLSGNELQEVFEEAKDECKKKGGEVAAKIGGARRRSALLLPNYRTNTKLCHNHFRRPTDVRIREDRRPTVAELSSQKGVAQKARGWKLYHLSTQMEVMVRVYDIFGSKSILTARSFRVIGRVRFWTDLETCSTIWTIRMQTELAN